LRNAQNEAEQKESNGSKQQVRLKHELEPGSIIPTEMIKENEKDQDKTRRMKRTGNSK